MAGRHPRYRGAFAPFREYTVNTQEFGILCTNTYLFILDYFLWASITPTLHKLLAHSEEILREVNNGCGLKSFSEEGSEACNKLLRKYRENLERLLLQTMQRIYSFDLRPKAILCY